jgi:hypothetical protein
MSVPGAQSDLGEGDDSRLKFRVDLRAFSPLSALTAVLKFMICTAALESRVAKRDALAPFHTPYMNYCRIPVVGNHDREAPQY